MKKVNKNFQTEAFDFIVTKVGLNVDNDDEMVRNFQENKDTYWNILKKYNALEEEILQNYSRKFFFLKF